MSNGVFAADSSNNSSTNSSAVQAQLVNSDVPFIENEGQQDSQVDYYANTLYGTAYVTSDGVTHVVGVNGTNNAVISEQFLDSNNNAITLNSKGLNQSSVKVNYYTGNDSTHWYTNVSTYNSVSLGEIYPNITVVLKATGGSVEKYFYLQPGSDVNDIVVQVLGATNLEILDDGNLAIYTENGTIIMSAPKAYQDDANVNVSYRILSNNTYGFTVTNYDPNKTLIIDPTLQYSTYLGGTDFDAGTAITVDDNGNIYITGYTFSSDFPLINAFQNSSNGNIEVFVSVFNSSGNLIYSTYIGGTSYDYGESIAVDGNGNIYITGYTGSTDFPTTTNAYQNSSNGDTEVFVSVFNSSGNLIYSTYLGGSYEDYGWGITVDNIGNIYVTGETSSSDFPTTVNAYQNSSNGIDDAFVSVFNSSRDLIYSTYLGGTQYDYTQGIAVDNSGNIYVTGRTSSSDFPTTSDAYQKNLNYNIDAFVSVFNSLGELIYSTYFGGDGYDIAKGIAVDSNGNIYITGQTGSTDFPVTPDAYQTTNKSWDAFVSVFNSSRSLIYSTYLGGSSFDAGLGIAVDDSGNIYVTGSTSSLDFPLVNAYQNSLKGTVDAVVFVFDTSRNLTFSTYFGGTDTDKGNGVALDDSGNIYITGYTRSSDFPTTADAYQNNNNGSGDVFLAKFARNNTLIAITDASAVKAQTVDLTATLTDSNGMPISGVKVEFFVNGISIGTATTNASGVATISYTIPLDPGMYTIEAYFAGNTVYNSSNHSGILTVNQNGINSGVIGGDVVNAATNTVGMQSTGTPILPLLFAVLLIFTGLTRKHKK